MTDNTSNQNRTMKYISNNIINRQLFSNIPAFPVALYTAIPVPNAHRAILTQFYFN